LIWHLPQRLQFPLPVISRGSRGLQAMGYQEQDSVGVVLILAKHFDY
jgi:hypothetical protein